MQEAQSISVHLVADAYTDRLLETLASLEQQTRQDFQLLVIDNGSTDSVSSLIQERNPAHLTLRNFHQQPFARVQNQALQFILSRWPDETWKERFVLFLHPDVVLAPESVSRLAAILERDRTLDGVAAKILRAGSQLASDGEERESTFTRIIESTGRELCKTRAFLDRGMGETDHGQYDGASEVFGLSSVCAMLRASSLARLKLSYGWFDEELDDGTAWSDFIWRLRSFGMRVRFLPDAVVWHHTHAAVGNERRSLASSFYLFLKNDWLVNLFFHLPWITWSFIKFCFAWNEWKFLSHMSRKRQEAKDKYTLDAKRLRAWIK